MADYKAPLKDIRFVMNEVFGAEQLWASLAGTKDTIDIETADAVLEEAGKITAALVAPLSREGDEEGPELPGLHRQQFVVVVMHHVLFAQIKIKSL